MVVVSVGFVEAGEEMKEKERDGGGEEEEEKGKTRAK